MFKYCLKKIFRQIYTTIPSNILYSIDYVIDDFTQKLKKMILRECVLSMLRPEREYTNADASSQSAKTKIF